MQFPRMAVSVTPAVTTLKLDASHELDGAWSGDRPVPGTEGVARGGNVGHKCIAGARRWYRPG